MEKRILTVQDVSCVGQCSLTVALPILSAFGFETAVLPTAVLSNHTYRFGGWTFNDLTEDIPLIADRWKKENLSFDTVYTGYLGSKKQIKYILDMLSICLKTGGVTVVDPVMADNGSLYHGFDMDFVEEMKGLVKVADVVLPNVTEACLLTGVEYRDGVQSEEYINRLISGFVSLGAKKVVLTGVSFSPELLGVAVYDGRATEYRFEKLVNKKSHGTGDIFASAFTGAYMQGDTLADAAQFAAKVVIQSILKTTDDGHWYGVRFEKALPMITDRIK